VRMNREIWTIVAVTIVTVLVWAWAAGETRGQKATYATVRFVVPDAEGQWLVEPAQQRPRVILEGSELAIQKAENLLADGLNVEISPQLGEQQVELIEAMRRHAAVLETGVRIAETDPARLTLEVDRVVQVPARVLPELPGVQTTDEVVEPAEAMISMPGEQRRLRPGDLTVGAFVDKQQLERLEAGVRHTLEAVLRLPETLRGNPNVTVSPSSAQISFTIRSQTRELTLASVRVQVSGPPESEYVVELHEQMLRNVTITADAGLIRRIEAEEMYVAAMVHLSLLDKDQRITEKPVAYFVALPSGGGPGWVLDQVRVGDSDELPVIHLSLSERPAS
jgi:hypothetical protein